MAGRLQNELDELLRENVISEETAQRIEDYYNKQSRGFKETFFKALSIMGAILIGLGVVLIIGHNWYYFPKSVKIGFAFLPLLIGHVWCGYSLWRQPDQINWRETSGSFLFFALGACLALISQIYQIQGTLPEFLLTWMVLAIPIMYVMRSGMSSLLYWVGSTYFVIQAGYTWSYVGVEALWYLALIGAGLPFCVWLYRKRGNSNYVIVHNWIVPLSITVALGAIIKESMPFMMLAYVSLLSLLFIIGRFDYFKDWRMRSNGFLVIGSLGTVIVLLVTSYYWYWEHLYEIALPFNELMLYPEFYISIGLTLAAGALLYWNYRNQSPLDIVFMEIVFIIFWLTFFIGMGVPVLSMLLINMLLFIIGFAELYEGAVKDHLGILNYGLLIIAVMIICRFFDIDFSYITRGIVFIIIGAAFFLSNYWMLRERKSD